MKPFCCCKYWLASRVYSAFVRCPPSSGSMQFCKQREVFVTHRKSHTQAQTDSEMWRRGREIETDTRQTIANCLCSLHTNDVVFEFSLSNVQWILELDDHTCTMSNNVTYERRAHNIFHFIFFLFVLWNVDSLRIWLNLSHSLARN